MEVLIYSDQKMGLEVQLIPVMIPNIWIGGYAYANNVSGIQNHHPDQHNLIFDPNNPKRAFSAQDGGISVTNDITSTPVSWSLREDGYNVTQFYTVSIHPDSPMTNELLEGHKIMDLPSLNLILAVVIQHLMMYLLVMVHLRTWVRIIFLTSSQRGRAIRYNYSVTGRPYKLVLCFSI